MNDRSYLEDLGDEARKYADLKLDELKLKTAGGLSLALGRALSMFLIIAVLAIVLGLLAFALLQWVNAALGAPWGTLIVCGAFTILLAVLFVFRKRMFRDMFVKIFIDIFYDREDNE